MDDLPYLEGGLSEVQQSLLDALRELLDRVRPLGLDPARSSVAADTNGLHVTLAHRINPGYTISIDASDGEIVVSYGREHEHFRPDDDPGDEAVGPFGVQGTAPKVVGFVEQLLLGRIELQVWTRPLMVKTRSYWINDRGERELFLRGGTAAWVFGWARRPEILRIEFAQDPFTDDAERLLVALHDHGGTLFDQDEIARTREWMGTPDGASLARRYLAIADDPSREPELRARIEGIIRS